MRFQCLPAIVTAILPHFLKRLIDQERPDRCMIHGRRHGNGRRGARLGGNLALAQQGPSGSDGKDQTRTGGAVGGAVGGAGELINKVVGDLPQRIVRSFIPGINQETAQYAVDKGLATPAKMLEDSNGSLADLGTSIGNAVRGATEDGATVPPAEDLFTKIASNFPESGLSPEDIGAKLKQLVPLKSNIVDKIVAGTASVEDLQNFNSALGKATFKTVFDDPTVKAGKEVGNAAYHEFGDLIKSYLTPEEGGLYDEYSKESTLNAALKKAVRSGQKSKLFTLRDLVAITSGVGAGSMIGAGPVGGAVGYLGEKALTNPGLNLGVAGLISKLGTPAGQAVGRGVSGATTKGIAQFLNSLSTQKQP